MGSVELTQEQLDAILTYEWENPEDLVHEERGPQIAKILKNKPQVEKPQEKKPQMEMKPGEEAPRAPGSESGRNKEGETGKGHGHPHN